MGSFSWKGLCRGRTVMVVVPHEDDEINCAGAAIRGAAEEGLEVVCLFVTTGNDRYIPAVRLTEAIRSLRALGVPEDHVLFLGYPDGGMRGQHSVLLHGQDGPITAAGSSVTEGMEGHPEFCMACHGVHHPLTWRNLIEDLKEALRLWRPTGIIAVDWDTHPDHRMTSEAFDTAMGELLREDPSWRPVVLKSFAYNMSFHGKRDWFAPNLYSSIVNEARLNDGPALDNPAFAWEERIRVPVPSSCRQPLSVNPLWWAITCHVSQRLTHQAPGILNGDMVYWRRETANLALTGRLSASSGEAKYLADFRLIGTSDVTVRKLDWAGCLWVPEEGDAHPWCRCDLDAPRQVGAVAFWCNGDGQSRILRGTLTLSTGLALPVGPLPARGRQVVTLPIQDGVTWVRFEIEESEGPRAGLAEWEILENGPEAAPFVKVCVGAHFAYDWMLREGDAEAIGAWNPAGRPLRWTLDGQPMELTEIHAACARLTRSARIRVEWADDPAVWDEAVVRPARLGERLRREWRGLRDRLTRSVRRETEKIPHHRLERYTNKRCGRA